MVPYLIVTLDGIHEGLVSHDLGFPIEESLKAVLDGLQLLFADLEETEGEEEWALVPPKDHGTLHGRC